MDALPRDLETVLFDAGGVLLDLDYAYLRRLIEPTGVETEEAALSHAEARARTQIERRVRGGGRTGEAWRDYFRLILHDVGVRTERHEPLIDSLWEAHQRVGLWTVAIPGAREVVAKLRDRGLKIGVVSNAEGRVERDLNTAGYAGLLQAVVDSHLVGVEKPDPEIFRIAVVRLETSPERCVFVGDVPSVDVEGARSAGITPVLLDRHGLYPDADALRVQSVKELIELLRS